MGARLLRHLHNFTTGGAAHDGIVHQQHVFAPKFHTHGIELLANRFSPLLLSRHDKGTPDIAVLDKAFTKAHSQAVGKLQGAGTAGIRNRDDHIDIQMPHRRR